ncbi:DUF421 domain-containing protein [Enteractinococcus fodinae]|uniref:Uncharacterized membrane protein YcaP (DUF421 family) n=1 Tax=Enteractinococcus fodinae TaxID=684663 RepID=A0ABU2AWU9_9MICC|nr:YetF domain-containing protein [Enteractinococcus fodinae]MDR7345830.1 uncharacterized membrane protein YcaP (DUF421 family) [Enteractinococcus fodinae]
MDVVIRAAAVYLLILLIMRISGKRTMAQVTIFDFILLLIIGEAVAEALVGEDPSLTAAALIVTTLVLLDRVSDYLGWRVPRLKRILESAPVVLVEDGRPLRDTMNRERISDDDILSSARETQGLESMDQIKWAVLETSGTISIVAKQEESA